MTRPTMTARHETPSVEIRELCGVVLTTAGAELTVTWEQGDESDALRTLERAYADVKRQIQGHSMLVIVPGEHQEDQ